MLPTIVSFFGGDEYYRRAAELLADDCRRLGLDYDIRELVVEPGEIWIDVCRRKIPFYLECHRRAAGGILWVDVDSRILRVPTFLEGIKADVGAFLRGFRYAREFDPIIQGRFFSPAFLFFNATDTGRRFLELAAALEQSAPRGQLTDDYFLQEAWLKFPDQLHLDIWPPKFVAFEGGDDAGDAYFRMHDSGHVAVFSGVAQQHAPPLLESRRKLNVVKSLVQEARERGAVEVVQVLTEEVRRLDGELNRASPATQPAAREDHIVETRRRLWKASRGRTKNQRAKREWVDLELRVGNHDKAEDLCRQLLRSETEGDRHFARAMLYRLDLIRQAAARPGHALPLWWMEQPFRGNFGDVLSPYLVQKLSNRTPVFAPADQAVLMAGSIIKFARAGSTVWGSGTPRMTDYLDPAARYTAVRGPLTRELVQRWGGTCAAVYGDPAVLLPCVYRPPAASPRYKLGLIRHTSHAHLPLVLDDVKEISIYRLGHEEIEAFIDELHDCECVLSSSLHGLIVAHAYGIPAEWCTFTGLEGSVSGDGTKFIDYFQSVGLDVAEPMVLDPSQPLRPAQAAAVRTLPARRVDVQRLAEAAPFEVTAPIRNHNLTEV